MHYIIRTLVPCALLIASGAGHAASADAPAKGAPATKSAPQKKAPGKTETSPPAAGAEQIEAAQRVYYGAHECEFNQSLAVNASTRFPDYVDVVFGKIVYLMKPVLSPTGAIRLEHTKGQTVLVQIAAKSMLLNVKTGQRMVDECIGQKHREATEAAKRAAVDAASAQEQAKAAAATASAPVASASAPAVAASAPAAPASQPGSGTSPSQTR